MQSYSDLPDEITSNIFIQLPTKSIGRCRCISKTWLDLLAQPELIRSHLHRGRNLQQESLVLSTPHRYSSLYTASFRDANHLFDKITIPATKLTFPLHRDDNWGRFLGTCDGLLLVGDNKSKNFVINPNTKEIREVPPLPFVSPPYNPDYIAFGFGYDFVDDDYNIVSISFYFPAYLRPHHADPNAHSNSTITFACEYSLKTGSWKRAEGCLYDYVYYFHTFNSGVVVDSHICWLIDDMSILSFDLVKEEFCAVAPPPGLGLGITYMHLAMLGGYLCLSDSYRSVVWVMREFGVKESRTNPTDKEAY